MQHPFHFHYTHRHSFHHHAAPLPSLAANRLIGFAGVAMIGLFFPIFLYELFDLSIFHVLLLFLISYGIKAPSSVLAAMTFRRIGLRNAMLIGIAGVALFFLSLYFLSAGIAPVSLMLGLAVIGLDLSTSFYWAPFHIDMATYTKPGRRGRVTAMLNGTQQVLGFAAPILGGFLISTFGFSVGFIAGMLVYTVSAAPLLFMPNARVSYEFGFFETFGKLFAKPYRGLAGTMLSFGAQDFVGAIIWPIFLFTVFGGRYFDIGLFAAVIVLISLAFEMFIGKESDTGALPKVLRWGAWIHAGGWIWKSLVDTVIGVFAATTFHSFGSIMLRTPMNTAFYGLAADAGHYKDELTIVREVGLNAGRTLMCAMLLGLTAVFSIPASFVAAAAASLALAIVMRARMRQA